MEASMEIQLYKALIAAGVSDQIALDLTDALEKDIREKIRETRTDLATKADLAETKAEIIKWNIGTIMAAVGLTIAIVKLIG
jgi:hypothetical protein